MPDSDAGHPRAEAQDAGHPRSRSTAHYYRGQLVNEANVLFLRLAEGPWQRIFIEVGVVFWQMVDSRDSPDQDRHHYTLTDLGAVHGLVGQRLVNVTTADVPAGGELRLLFSGDVCVSVCHVDRRSRVAVERAVPALAAIGISQSSAV